MICITSHTQLNIAVTQQNIAVTRQNIAVTPTFSVDFNLYIRHMGPKSHTILMFVGVQKDAKQCDFAKLDQAHCSVGQHSEYDKAL